MMNQILNFGSSKIIPNIMLYLKRKFLDLPEVTPRKTKWQVKKSDHETNQKLQLLGTPKIIKLYFIKLENSKIIDSFNLEKCYKDMRLGKSK